MQPNPQIIKQARQAQNMTQEQLAAAMNVSRQTVSHWENGRVQPDAETMARLSALLSLSEDSPSTVKKSPLSIKSFVLGFACGAVCALLAVYTVPSLLKTQTATPANNIVATEKQAPTDPRYTPEWYLQGHEREEGKAHLIFSLVRDPVTVIERDREPYVGWEVDYRFEERNGVGFTVTAFTEIYFTADGEITYSAVFKGDELSIPLDNVYLPAGGRVRYSVFKPVDATTLYGVCIDGVDDNGNERTFRYAFPLAQGEQQ